MGIGREFAGCAFAGLLAVCGSLPAVAQPASASPATVSKAPYRIGGVKIHEVDLDKAIAYYQGVFGLTLFNRTGTGNRGEAMLTFIDAPKAVGQPDDTVPEPVLVLMADPSFVHVQSQLQDFFIRVPDFEAVKKRAEAAGYPPVGGNGTTFLNIPDPSGNIVELAPYRYVKPRS